jgi:hypothetical protein
MTVSIYGRSYNVKRSALRSDFLNLIMDEDTFLLYIAQSKDQVNDFDTLLAINIECQKIIPMFLSVFNEMVDEYFIPIKYSCPAVYIINVDVANYIACDKSTISQRRNAMFNKYIGYVLEDDVLYICPTFACSFETFGTVTKYLQEKPREPKRTIIFETPLSKKDTVKVEEKPIVQRPMQSEVQSQVPNPNRHAFTPASQTVVKEEGMRDVEAIKCLPWFGQHH